MKGLKMNEQYMTEIGEDIINLVSKTFKKIIKDSFFGFCVGFGFTFAAWCFIQIAGDFV